MNIVSRYETLSPLHNAITATAQPAIATNLALAFFKEGDVMSEHVRCILLDPLRPRYLATHMKVVPRTEDDFNNWEGKPALCDAIILDTMMNVQTEMLGADDSRADYMPDGLSQIQTLTEDSYDINGFLWYCLNNLHLTIRDHVDYDEEKAEHVTEQIAVRWDIFLQDATSHLLYDLAVAFNA